jgi:hypothetical protein
MAQKEQKNVKTLDLTLGKGGASRITVSDIPRLRIPQDIK